MMRNERDEDDDVDGRPGEGDHDLLARLFRHALQPRQAADRQERDVGRADTVEPRRECVAVFVRDDAGEQREDEDKPCTAAGAPPSW